MEADRKPEYRARPTSTAMKLVYNTVMAQRREAKELMATKRTNKTYKQPQLVKVD